VVLPPMLPRTSGGHQSQTDADAVVRKHEVERQVERIIASVLIGIGFLLACWIRRVKPVAAVVSRVPTVQLLTSLIETTALVRFPSSGAPSIALLKGVTSEAKMWRPASSLYTQL